MVGGRSRRWAAREMSPGRWKPRSWSRRSHRRRCSGRNRDIERLVRTRMDTFGRHEHHVRQRRRPGTTSAQNNSKPRAQNSNDVSSATNLHQISFAFKHATAAIITRGDRGTSMAAASASTFNAYRFLLGASAGNKLIMQHR